MLDHNEKTRFEDLVLPHLNAAYNLAGRLLRNPADAEDATQEALVRAYRFFPNFRGTTARSWLLQIVRNSCYSWLRKNRPWEWNIEFDEEIHRGKELSPEAVASRDEERIRLTSALESLSACYREVIALRELVGCSYKEIAEVTGIPIGTVMSALYRARERLQRTLTNATANGTPRPSLSQSSRSRSNTRVEQRTDMTYK